MTGDAGAKVREITRLARSGALERATSLLESSGLAAADGDPRALALRARLHKDRAKRALGAERVRWLERSAADYLRAAEIGGASYPLINAATLSLLAGRHREARRLAQRVLDQLDANPDEAETRYWLGATRAEALLLLDKLPEARAALRAAVAEAPLAWEDRAATIGQFAAICEELAYDAGWLDPLRPPRSLQYGGIMGVPQSDARAERRIAEWLEAENVGFGFGALAAGADIWIAEALLARGAALNVVLPCPVEAFRRQSVAAVDPAWLPRFDRLLDAADSVDELDTASAPSPAAVKLSDAVALGLTIHNARVLQSEPIRLRISSPDEGAGTSAPEGVREVTIAAARERESDRFQVEEGGLARVLLRAGTGPVEIHTRANEAWETARARLDDRTSVALDYRFVDAEQGENPPPDRLDALAAVAEEGQILASKALAFALLAEAPQIRVETMGEIRSALGFVPVYALSDS